jgi:hypothetical protein
MELRMLEGNRTIRTASQSRAWPAASPASLLEKIFPIRRTAAEQAFDRPRGSNNIMHTSIRIATATLMLMCAPSLRADDAREKKNQAVLSAAQADADFSVQGEYTGEISIGDDDIELGTQVIAQGNGKFHTVAYVGGLPGDGWDEERTREFDLQTENNVAVHRGDDFGVTIKDGEFIVENRNGDEVGRLQKIQRKSTTLGKKPPEDAVVLFDGMSADNFEGGRISKDGLLIQGATSLLKFQDCTLHLEFMLSYMPHNRGQDRSNSGCYLQGRYEVQILDSFGLSGEQNECGAIYGVRAPTVNMCFPPLSWQTYDIDFTAAKFNEKGEKTDDARITVSHNGVTVQNKVKVPQATRAAPLQEAADPGPLFIQDHRNPLRFRNIWIVERS